MENRKNRQKNSPPGGRAPCRAAKRRTDSATGKLSASPAADRPRKKSKKAQETKKASSGRELVKLIEWFPGHMTKAIREINESLSAVDLAIELCDARIPHASRNPNMERILGGKPSLTVMNKASLADPVENARWKAYFASQGKTVLFTDCMTGEGVKDILPTVRTLLKDKLDAYERKGMRRLPRVMILGVTNCGKSTLINKLCGTHRAKTEDRAGVTRTQQWVTVEGALELLDTPGILWPKFDEEAVGLHLAFTGAINDDILDTEEIAVILLRELLERYPALVAGRYKLTEEDLANRQPFEVFETIAAKRGLLLSGAEPDTLRCAHMLLDEYRAGKIGRITLDRAPSPTQTEERS